jgi:hypothetical protein
MELVVLLRCQLVPEIMHQSGGHLRSSYTNEAGKSAYQKKSNKEKYDDLFSVLLLYFQWFWACIQMEACAAEKMYTFQKVYLRIDICMNFQCRSKVIIFSKCSKSDV